MLFVLAGVKEVYACVLSKGGEEVLKKQGISYQFGEIADTIINRSGNDICPMEKAVMGMDNPDSAYKAILRTVEELQEIIYINLHNIYKVTKKCLQLFVF